jgi:hypothetical protein
VKHIRKRITYANVMSSIAVFLVLGGGAAYAAKKIGSNEIKGNSITTGKIKKEAVSASKIKKNAVTTAKIANGAVTGAKLNLGTVGTVPNAAHAINADNANNANAVAGNTIRAISFTGNPTVGPTEILNLDGFTLTATCSGADELSVVANGPAGSRLQSAGNQASVGGEVVDGLFNDTLTPSSNTQLLPTDDDLVVGHTEFSLGNGGRNVSVIWEAESFGASSGPHCTFTGYAIG